MNDEAARQGRPDTNPITAADDSKASGVSLPAFEIARLRAGIVNALEAIEDGDVGYALAILRALDETPAQMIGCPLCSLHFEWPGLRDHHLLMSHAEPEEMREAA